MVAQAAKASAASARFLPFVVAAGTVSIVAGYVDSQLRNSRSIMDSRFAQYNTAQSESQRRRTFEGTNGDPRKSMFNVLGW